MHRVMTFKFLVAIAWLLSFSSVSAATQVEMSEYV